MKSSAAIKAEIKSLSEQILSITGDGNLTMKARAVQAVPLSDQLKALQSELVDAQQLEQITSMLAGSGVSNMAGHDGGLPAGTGAAPGRLARSLALQGKTVVAPPSLTLQPEQSAALYDAARSLKSLRVETKAIADSTAIAPAGIANYRLPPVAFAREPMRVLSLMPNVATDRPIEIFYRTAGTANAAPVLEGGLKPESAISYAPIQVAVTKIAHTVHVTDESLEDFNGFAEYLSADMVNGVINSENAELLSSAGTGVSKWPGLLNTTGVLTRAKASETYSLDVIEEAIDDLRVGASYCEPTDIVLHPSTWGSLRRTKDGQNRYIVDPDPTAATRLSLWGIPVTLTTQMTAGKALIGDFQGGCYAFVRQNILVESTNSNNDDFVKNLNTVRAETRIGLAVTRPASFIVASGL